MEHLLVVLSYAAFAASCITAAFAAFGEISITWPLACVVACAAFVAALAARLNGAGGRR